MTELLNLGENSSFSDKLNYLSQCGKIFIMDNHLGAFWTLHQLDLKKSYDFLHVDRHYDLIPFSHLDEPITKINWKQIPVSEITTYSRTTEFGRYQYIRWDNYIHLFNKLHPRVIDFLLLVTQKDGTLNYKKKKFREIEIFDLLIQEFATERKWIFNIDIDYFFTHVGDETVQMFHDDYILKFGEWLHEERKNTEQIIICLSPECCGGWQHSKRVANLVLKPFGISL